MNIGAAGSGVGDKGLNLPLWDTFRLAWNDPELRQRINFVLMIFVVYVVGINIPVPMQGYSAAEVTEKLINIPFFSMLDAFGGGALKRLSIFALGLNPYITSSIIMQILTTAFPQWKKEMQEGGEYARRQQNRRTRFLTLALCFAQGWGMLQLIKSGIPDLTLQTMITVMIYWTAGSMFVLWLGEQLSEKGIGNGVSLMIFVGITVSMPTQSERIWKQYTDGIIGWWQILLLIIVFLVVTWFVVKCTVAQRRIPIQHMRRQVGTRSMGGQTSYLPLPLSMAGVIPIIFATSIAYMPSQFSNFFPPNSSGRDLMERIVPYFIPDLSTTEGLVGCLFFTGLIFFFSYFWAAIQYNVDDISNNLKRSQSFIPGVRPGKQTRDFLDGVISRVTIVGAGFLAAVALIQFIAPSITKVQQSNYFFGTSLLILVSVALDTMRQIESNLMMRQYNQ